jgi:hypothetical protein
VTVKDLHDLLHEYLASDKHARVLVRTAPQSGGELDSDVGRVFLDTISNGRRPVAQGEVCLVIEGVVR